MVVTIFQTQFIYIFIYLSEFYVEHFHNIEKVNLFPLLNCKKKFWKTEKRKGNKTRKPSKTYKGKR